MSNDLKNPFICKSSPKDNEICFANEIIKIPQSQTPAYCSLNTTGASYKSLQHYKDINSHKLNLLCNSHNKDQCTAQGTAGMCVWNGPETTDTDNSWKIGIGVGIPAIIVGIILVVYFSVKTNKK